MTFHVFISIQIKEQNKEVMFYEYLWISDRDTAKLYVQFLDQNSLQI